MPPHLLPRDPRRRNVERRDGRALLIGGQLRQLGRERGNRGGARQVARMLKLPRQGRAKRLHQYGGSAHRRQRLEQPSALRREFLNAPSKRQRDGDWSGERLDALGLVVGELAIDRLKIVEMMKHDPQRHARPFCDTRRSRAQVAFVEKIKQRINHGMPRARRAG